MIIILNISAEKFSLNGIPYFKNFMPLVVGGMLKIINVYDTRLELTALDSYSNYSVDGVTYPNLIALQNALLPVLYTRNSLNFDSDLPFYNQVTKQNGITSLGLDKTFNAGWEWLINNVKYTNAAPITITFPLATAGKQRLDRVVATNLNTFVRIPGVESISSPTADPRPDNTVDVTFVLVSDTEVFDPTPPVIGPPDMALKLDKGTYVGNAQDLSDRIDTKLNISDYNDRFKGVFPTEAALISAHPTGSAGDAAQVNELGSTKVINYSWDAEDNTWVEGGSGGSSATNTDALPEGSLNLYFKTARVLATVLSGISFLTGGSIVSTDTILVAFGKLQKQINDLVTGKQSKLVAGKNIVIDTTDALNPIIHATTIKKYNAVMHFGNSICRHPIIAGTWWGDWGMAATIRDNDYVHRFWSMLKTINPNVTSDALNIAAWETNYATFNKATLDPYLVGKDLVVLRLGENVTYYADFQNQYKILVQYIQSKAPNADIILGGQFWTNATKETAMQNVATELGLPFVVVKHLDSATYKQTVGGVVQGDDGLPHTITSSGVANHPNDLGMLKIAEALFADISYTTETSKVTPQKEIIANVTLDDSYNGCIVKVKATSTVTVPSTLKPNFNCVFDTWTGFTTTFVAGSGVTISSSGLKLLSEKMGTLYKDGSAPYFRLKGETSV